MFIALMRAQNADIPGTDAELIRAGELVCVALRDGTSIDELAATFEAGRVPVDTGSMLLAVSPASYCPEWSDRMSEWIGGN
jgi:hypothetical protein